ncbi:hypothetical protein EJ08DRAFT_650539 [Tothia fuscella]|uniref:Uncharacterized protein n=1 Tax=Tothia fuscella TaxID=1048955 RepID=A0A9P4NNV8_9PEZI|nr:hypothetical protein EJ08DRAFT_650539 [Tothia fuscella]
MSLIERLPTEIRCEILKALDDWPTLYRATLSSKDLFAAFKANPRGILKCFPPQPQRDCICDNCGNSEPTSEFLEAWLTALEQWKESSVQGPGVEIDDHYSGHAEALNRGPDLYRPTYAENSVLQYPDSYRPSYVSDHGTGNVRAIPRDNEYRGAQYPDVYIPSPATPSMVERVRNLTKYLQDTMFNSTGTICSLYFIENHLGMLCREQLCLTAFKLRNSINFDSINRVDLRTFQIWQRIQPLSNETHYLAFSAHGTDLNHDLFYKKLWREEACGFVKFAKPEFIRKYRQNSGLSMAEKSDIEVIKSLMLTEVVNRILTIAGSGGVEWAEKILRLHWEVCPCEICDKLPDWVGDLKDKVGTLEEEMLESMVSDPQHLFDLYSVVCGEVDDMLVDEDDPWITVVFGTQQERAMRWS